jgi:hypothetical protein
MQPVNSMNTIHRIISLLFRATRLQEYKKKATPWNSVANSKNKPPS